MADFSIQMANKRSIKAEDDEFNPKKRQCNKGGASPKEGSSGKFLAFSLLTTRTDFWIPTKIGHQAVLPYFGLLAD
jgi:hypothetical protein